MLKTLYRELKSMVEARGGGVDFACDELAQAFRQKAISPDDVSFRRLAETFMGREYVEACNPADDSGIRLIEAAGSATTSLAFANITGQVVYSKVLDGWNMVPTIGDQLCSIVSTPFEQERIPGMTKLGNKAEGIGEAEPYPLAGVGEEYVDTPRTRKFGLIVPVTKEAIFFDRTGLVMRRAAEVGEALQVRRERAIIECATGSSSYRYTRNGTTVDVYNASTPYANIASSNALADWTDIEAAELLFDGMTDPATGEPIMPSAMAVLVPSALKHTARRIANATEIRVGNAATAGNVNTISANPIAGDYAVLSSPYVKAITTSATTWYLGDFKKAFAYMENWPITVVQAPSNSDQEFARDIVLQFKASERGTPAVVEPRYVVKCTA